MLELSIDYIEIKAESKDRDPTYLKKNRLVQEAAEAIRTRDRTSTRTLQKSARSTMNRTANEKRFVAQFVLACRAPDGIWLNKKDDELNWMCGVAVDIMKQLD